LSLRDWLAKRVREGFFHLAYWRRPRWDTGITPPEVISFAADHAPGRALDLGCGTATNTIYLAQQGWEAWGVDFVGRAVHSGRQKARGAGASINLLHGDVSLPLKIPGQFDLILDIGCLHNLTQVQRKGYFDNLTRLLARGGHYLLYGFLNNPEQIELPGLYPADFDWLEGWLSLENRVESTDPNGRRSTWIEFSRP